MKDRIFFIFLSIPVIFFLVLYFFLSCFNRLAADDLYYTYNVPAHGAWQTMLDLYNNISGRWTAYVLAGLVIDLCKNNYFIFAFNILTLVTLCGLIYLILAKIVRVKLNQSISKKTIFLFSILLAGALFFTSYSIAETWFWIIQVCTYLWCLIACLLLLFVLMDANENKRSLNTFIQYMLIFCASVFIGGSSESYALSVGFLLLFYLFFSRVRFQKVSFLHFPASKTLIAKIVFAVVILGISFVITMLAPGNKNRLNLLPQAGFGQLCWVQIKSFIKIIFIRTPQNLPLLLIFSLPWLVLGKKCSATQNLGLLSFLKKMIPYFFLALLFIFVFLMPTSFVMVELGPDRTLSLITFFIAFCFAALFFLLGQKVKLSSGTFAIAKYVSLPGLLTITVFYIITQFPIARKYSLACDKRNVYLHHLSQTNIYKTVELEPLPPSGMLFSSEISTDSLHGLNYLVEKSLHLNFKVKLKQRP